MPFLDWVNKSQATSVAKEVPYDLLRFESAHGDTRAENLLIQGDNLLALKALLPFYRGQVKCIFIDPPYNTQSAFEHYDDKLEHSQWLSMMYPHGGARERTFGPSARGCGHSHVNNMPNTSIQTCSTGAWTVSVPDGRGPRRSGARSRTADRGQDRRGVMTASSEFPLTWKNKN